MFELTLEDIITAHNVQVTLVHALLSDLTEYAPDILVRMRDRLIEKLNTQMMSSEESTVTEIASDMLLAFVNAEEVNEIIDPNLLPD
jgi:hypothetical protein